MRNVPWHLKKFKGPKGIAQKKVLQSFTPSAGLWTALQIGVRAWRSAHHCLVSLGAARAKIILQTRCTGLYLQLRSPKQSLAPYAATNASCFGKKTKSTYVMYVISMKKL